MRDKTYHIYLDSPERKLLIHSLVEVKNQLIQQTSVKTAQAAKASAKTAQKASQAAKATAKATAEATKATVRARTSPSGGCLYPLWLRILEQPHYRGLSAICPGLSAEVPLTVYMDSTPVCEGSIPV